MKSSRFNPVSLLVAVTFASSSAAAAPPRISQLADRSNLTEQDLRSIEQFASHWCEQLNDGDPAEVDQARDKLAEPLRAVEVGSVFRMQYTQAALPGLKAAIDDGKPQAAVNAMQILAQLGTPRALEVIVANADEQDQPDFGIRLWAAKSFPLAVSQGTLPQNEINKALRSFGHAAQREDNWLVLRRQFEAVASVDGVVSRDVQLDALRQMTERMAEVNPGPSDLMHAAYPALKLVRDEYLRLNAADQKPFGKELAPVLCDVCTVANVHWKNAQADTEAKEIYGGAIHISENLLRLIDPDQRPGQRSPQTQLGPAWNNRNERAFRADHQQWQAVLSKPPYR